MLKEIIVPFLNETIHNHFFSQRIDASVNNIQFKIDAFYKKYLKNIFVLAVLNVVFLIVSLASGFIISIRTTGFIIAFILLFVIISRTLYVILGYIKQVIQYRRWLVVFIRLSVKNRSFQIALENMLKQTWVNQYNKMTNTVLAKLHSVFSNIGLLKSAEDIEDEFVVKHYQVIRKYLVGNIMYKTLFVFLIFWVYTFLLQPLAMHIILGIRIWDIIIYPVKLLETILL